MIQVYCPCCGEWFEAAIDALSPGTGLEATCSECGTVWSIGMEFVEVEGGHEPEPNAEQLRLMEAGGD